MDSAQPCIGSSSRTHEDLDYQKIFDAYLYEYLLKRNLVTSAEIFKQEAQLRDLRDRLLTDSPGDFLFDWWTIFYESYTATLHGPQGNLRDLLPQYDQGSSSYELPPLPPFLQDPVSMPLIHVPGYIPQPWLTPDGSSLLYGAGVGENRQAWSTPAGSQLVTSAGDLLPVWCAREGVLGLSNEHSRMQCVDNLSFRSPGHLAAVVLTPRNLNTNSLQHFLHPSPLRTGIRQGLTPNDPIDVEAPMASPASVSRGRFSSASRGRRPRRHNQPPPRDSSLMGAIRVPAPTSACAPVITSMSQPWMAGHMAHYSRHGQFPAGRAISALSLSATFNASGGSWVPSSSFGVGSHDESNGPFLSNYASIFSSTSNQTTPNSANEMNSKQMINGTVGESAAVNLSNSTQEMVTEKNGFGAKTATLGKPCTAAIVSNPISGPEMENNEEVSSGMKDSNIADEDGEKLSGNDTDVGVNLNDNKSPADVTDNNAVAPAPQLDLDRSY